MKAMEAAGKPPRPPQDPVHHFQRVDRRQRAVAALRRVDALLGGAMQTLRVIGGASRHDKPFGKKYALNLRQIFVLNDSLQSMKHSLLEAVELDGGGLAAPERAWMPLLHGLTEFIIELRHLHGIDFDPREYDGFPFRELDLLHLTSTICRIHPSLRAPIRQMQPVLAEPGKIPVIPEIACAAPYVDTVEDGNGEDVAPEVVHGGVGLSPMEGGELVAHATPAYLVDGGGVRALSNASLALGNRAQLQRLQPAESGQPGQLSLQTHALFPTLVSHFNALDSGMVDAAFLGRLNTAVLGAYAALLEERAEKKLRVGTLHQEAAGEELQPDVNGDFFMWQGGGTSADLKNMRRFLGDEDIATLKRLTSHACLAHIMAHRRPQTLEELGWPDIQPTVWASVFGGGEAQETEHETHVHSDSVCSGAFYTQTPERGGSPIVFYDPRGAWAQFARDGGRRKSEAPWLFTTQEGDDPTSRGTQLYGAFYQQYQFHPKQGDICLFPSWLVHRVAKQGATGAGRERITWSFNLGSGIDAWSRTAV